MVLMTGPKGPARVEGLVPPLAGPLVFLQALESWLFLGSDRWWPQVGLPQRRSVRWQAAQPDL